MTRGLIGLWIVALAAAGGCASSAGAAPKEEPAHDVMYTMTSIGTANGQVAITYSDSDGQGTDASAAGAAQFWAKQIRTEAGQTGATMTARGESSDLKFALICSITVDGVQVATDRQSFSCTADFSFRDLASAKAVEAAKSPSPSATPVQQPTDPPAGCRFATEAEVTGVFSDAIGTTKPVLSTGGDANSCTYNIDNDNTRATIEWTPGGKPEISGADVKVSGLGGTAYWADIFPYSTLQVQQKKGLVAVTVATSPLLGAIDKKKIAIALLKIAAPRLPK